MCECICVNVYVCCQPEEPDLGQCWLGPRVLTPGPSQKTRTGFELGLTLSVQPKGVLVLSLAHFSPDPNPVLFLLYVNCFIGWKQSVLTESQAVWVYTGGKTHTHSLSKPLDRTPKESHFTKLRRKKKDVLFSVFSLKENTFGMCTIVFFFCLSLQPKS